MYKILDINEKIIKCRKCLRLVEFREKVATNKRKQFSDQKYWGKPVPGFGDNKAEILILGLAPAAHGGNRTGRVFTGDRSAEFLFRCLYDAKLSNQPTSENISDGLSLKNIYITVALKCVPPFDKPTAIELETCFSYLKDEILALDNVKTILTLGKIAFDSCLKFYNLKPSQHKFSHGARFQINDEIKIVASYHPSPRNVNTKRIDKDKMVKLLGSL